MERELKFGDLESIVLNAVWAIGEENKSIVIDVGIVHQRVNKIYTQKWAYTTVKTVLNRLAEKKFLKETYIGKKNTYKPLISRKQAGEDAVKKLVSLYFKNNYDSLVNCAQKLDTKAPLPSEIKPSDCA